MTKLAPCSSMKKKKKNKKDDEPIDELVADRDMWEMQSPPHGYRPMLERM